MVFLVLSTRQPVGNFCSSALNMYDKEEKAQFWD